MYALESGDLALAKRFRDKSIALHYHDVELLFSQSECFQYIYLDAFPKSERRSLKGERFHDQN